MTRPLYRLSPMQRFRRVRRLLREMQGQRALLQVAPSPRDAARASSRLIEANGALFAELQFLESAGILAALEECITLIFGGEQPSDELPSPLL